MRKFTKIFNICALLAVSISCTEKIFTDDIDCEQCYELYPDPFDLEINFTTFPNVFTTIILHHGKYSGSSVGDTFYFDKSPAYIVYEIDKDVSVEAVYNINGKITKAIDGTKMKPKRVSTACGSTCWLVEKTSVDVSLKY